MPDNLKFTEEGLKLHTSIAAKMEELMATGAAVAVTAPGVGTVIGAAVFVIGLIKMLTEDHTVVDALKKLQKQINEIQFVLGMLKERIDELVEQFAMESNRQTLRDLLDYLDGFRVLDTELIDRPNDVDSAVRVANEAGVLVDKFLRNEFEIWRWTDVIEKEVFDPATGQTRVQIAASLLHFKNIPTLPVYVMGVLTWLAAREKVVKAGQKHRLAGDQERLESHRHATSVRTNFDKYRDDDYGIPQTIAENIKSRIRAYAVASNRHAVNRICQFYFVVGSLMTGKSNPGPEFDLLMPEGTVLCTLDPKSLGSPDMEIELETKSGVDTLYELSEVLGRLVSGGSLGQQFIGPFANTEVFAPATLYVIDQNADLQWYRNESAAARGGSKVWMGPKKVGNGWGGFTAVFNGGGHAIYAIKPDGDLLWYAHDGFLDGSGRWRPWRPVGNGWQGFKSVFPGGEYVVYGIQPDGRLLWYRHDGAPGGGDVNTWAGYKEVDTGWHLFDKVFSGGDGIIYGIRPDGVLERRKHKGYLTGDPQWEPKEEIGTGWNGFHDVVAAADGVIYAFTRDGRILWYRYGKRLPLPPEQNPPGPRLEDMVTERPRRPASPFEDMATERSSWGAVTPQPGLDIATRIPGGLWASNVDIWEGPVEIKRNFPAFRSVFALMSMPYHGPS